MKTFRKNLNGSAMLWALCAMTVFVVISAAVMTMSLAGYQREADSMQMRQATFSCRSAIGIAAEDISKNGESSEFFPKDGELSAEFDMEGRLCVLSVKKDGENKLALSACARTGNNERRLGAIMEFDGENWGFTGFAGE